MYDSAEYRVPYENGEIFWSIDIFEGPPTPIAYTKNFLPPAPQGAGRAIFLFWASRSGENLRLAPVTIYFTWHKIFFCVLDSPNRCTKKIYKVFGSGHFSILQDWKSAFLRAMFEPINADVPIEILNFKFHHGGPLVPYFKTKEKNFGS